MFRWYERRESHPDTLMTSSLCQLLSRLAQVIIQISLIAITTRGRTGSFALTVWTSVFLSCVSHSAWYRLPQRGGELQLHLIAALHVCFSLQHEADVKSRMLQSSWCRDKQGVSRGFMTKRKKSFTEKSLFGPHIHSSSRSRDSYVTTDSGKSTASTSLLKWKL